MLYQHPRRRDPWPTLGTLIDANQRILFFQHNGNNCRIEGGCPPGIMGTFQHMFDTPWDLDEDGLLDFDRSCTKNRGLANAQLMLSNHFADEGLFPSLEISWKVNQLSVLRDRHEYCREKLEKKVNVILVDFWSLGGVIEYAQEENERRVGVVTLGTNVTEEAIVMPQRTTLSPSPRPSQAPSKMPSDTPSTSPSTISSSSPSAMPSIADTTSASPSNMQGGRSVIAASDTVIAAASSQNAAASSAKAMVAARGACLIVMLACAHLLVLL